MGVVARVLVLLSFLATAACGPARPAATAAVTTEYVPWAELKPGHALPQAPQMSPSPPYAIPPGTPTCTAGRLEGVAGHANGATGNVNMPILFRNRSAADCVVEGFPDVTVLDLAGRILASARGTAGRGTYFDDGPVLPILVKAETAALASTGSGAAAAGQLFINLSWYDCRRPPAASLAVDLPNGGGRLTVRFPMVAAYYMLCDTQPSYQALVRGPFSPAGIQWPPDLHRYISTSLAIDVPASVKAGTTLVYYVTISNQDTIVYDLDPCPDFMALLGPKTVVDQHMLNCAPVGHVAPGSRVKFQMRTEIPRTIPAGGYELTWSLADFRITQQRVTARVTVT